MRAGHEARRGLHRDGVRLARDPVLHGVAARVSARGAYATTLEVFLAYLLAVDPRLVPVVGARRPETIASLQIASSLAMEEEELVAIDDRFPVLGSLRRPPRRTATDARARDIVMMMVTSRRP